MRTPPFCLPWNLEMLGTMTPITGAEYSQGKCLLSVTGTNLYGVFMKRNIYPGHREGFQAMDFGLAVWICGEGRVEQRRSSHSQGGDNRQGRVQGLPIRL